MRWRLPGANRTGRILRRPPSLAIFLIGTSRYPSDVRLLFLCRGARGMSNENANTDRKALTINLDQRRLWHS